MRRLALSFAVDLVFATEYSGQDGDQPFGYREKPAAPVKLQASRLGFCKNYSNLMHFSLDFASKLLRQSSKKHFCG